MYFFHFSSRYDYFKYLFISAMGYLINDSNDYLSNYYFCQYTYNVFGWFLILGHIDRQTINPLKIEQAKYMYFLLNVCFHGKAVCGNVKYHTCYEIALGCIFWRKSLEVNEGWCQNSFKWPSLVLSWNKLRSLLYNRKLLKYLSFKFQQIRCQLPS